MVSWKEGRQCSCGRALRDSCARGFTLAEVLVVTAILSIMIFPVFEVLKIASNQIPIERDRRLIRGRASLLSSVMNHRVYYCATGMPLGKDEFKKAFGESFYAPFYWDGPISVRKSPIGADAGELRLVYVQPQEIKLKENFVFGKDGKTVYFTDQLDIDSVLSKQSGGPTHVKNCVVFKRVRPHKIPLIVRWIGRDRKSAEVAPMNGIREFKLLRGDELCLFAASKLYSKNGILYCDDIRLSGEQPRVNGVEDIRFSFDSEAKRLDVYALIRGDYKYDDDCDVSDAELWPKEIPSKPLLKKSKYRRRVVKIVYNLPNYLE